MTAGPFIMTNLEGLFSPFRDLETEMDELRTMRRVSQIWREMEQRDNGAWMMFGRFFDRQVDDMHGLSSPTWGSSLFSHSRPSRFGNHSFSESSHSSNKPDGRVVVEFPDEEKEIKIDIEEPSVVITEVEDLPEPADTSATGFSGNSSPTRKSSLISGGENNSVFSDSSFDVTSVSSVREEHTERSVDPVSKTEKFEKRTKKVDFSKMEVHFEPGSGKVNIVETNEKPPSNQLFRRKKRHRTRSDSPKLHFVGASENEPYKNVSPDSFSYEERHDISTLNSDLKLNRLSNNLDLSIFNLRNTLFKNSINDFDGSRTKNLLITSDVDKRDEGNYTRSKHTSIPQEDILLDKNSSYAKPSFNVSSKLQNLIKNSVKNQITLTKSQFSELKDINTDIEDELKMIKPQKINSNVKPGNVNSPSNTLKGRSHSLKRNNSRSKENTVSVINEINADFKNIVCKQSNGEEKSFTKKKVPVSRADSFKKNSRVTRQESQRSTSSRGSVNSDKCYQKKNNIIKDPSKREIGSGRINRTPSIGRLTSNSLKKGGIYVDGSPKKTKGATVTLISYTRGDLCSKQVDCSSKEGYNNVTVNNLESLKNKNRLMRKESLRSYCSKESLAPSPHRFAQKKNNDLLKDSLYERDLPKYKSKLSQVVPVDSLGMSGESNKLNNITSVAHVKRVSENNLKFKKTYSKNTAIVKRDSFKSGSGNAPMENLNHLTTKIKRISSDPENKNVSTESNYSNKNVFDTREAFHHEDSSLFQPIKKEKPLHSSKIQSNEIKTPVAIRKKSDSFESDNDSKENQKEVCQKLYRSNSKEKSNVRNNTQKFSRGPLKLSVTSLRRSKEPLRSFEKISNGWVGRCNMSAVSRDGKSETKWATKRVAEMKLTSHNNKAEQSRILSRDLVSPDASSQSSSRLTVHQQKESVMRLSSGHTSRRSDSQSSSSFSKNNIDSRKRSHHVYTPSSVSSHSSSMLAVTKRRPESRARSDTPIPSEPIYETLNSRRKAPITTISKRNRQPNPCCNI